MSTLQASNYEFVDTSNLHIDSIIGEMKTTSMPEGSEYIVNNIQSTDNTSIPVKTIPIHAIAPPRRKIERTFKLLQMWEGRVQLIDNGKEAFTAIITDKTNPDLPDEEITLSIEEIPKNDFILLKKGAVFYWSIGYADEPGRPRERVSRIRFRRLPKWTSRELIEARKKGAKLAKLFSSD